MSVIIVVNQCSLAGFSSEIEIGNTNLNIDILTDATNADNG